MISGVPDSLEFFNIVFFAVVLSTAAAGLDVRAARPPAAGDDQAEPALPRPLAETGTIRALGAEVVEYAVARRRRDRRAPVRDLGLPRDALVNVIVRGEEAILPRGLDSARAPATACTCWSVRR